MRYLGGKARTARRIAAEVATSAAPGVVYHEPFLGGGSVAAAVALSGAFDRMILTDAHPDLVALWQAAVFDGWTPPTEVTKEEYDALWDAPPSAIRGFVGFAASYNGKWWAGYGPTAPSTGRDYLAESARALDKKARALRSVGELTIVAQDYRTTAFAPGDVIYCDPPYAETTGYAGTGHFDSGTFWDRAAEWADDLGGHVFVSEFAAPSGWAPVWTVERAVTLARTTRRRTEGLYRRAPLGQLALDLST